MINTSTASFRYDLLGPILQEGFPEEAYVAHKILPTLLVQKRNGSIPSFLFSNDQALSIKHAPKTSYARIVSKLGSKSFSCEEAGVEEALSPEDYEIMGKDYAEMLISRRLVHTVLRARDIALSQAFFSATGETTFAANLVTAALAWDNAGGLPLDNILTAKRNIAASTGLPGNAMIIGYDAYIKLCKNVQIQSLVRNVMGYGGAAFTKAAVAKEIPTDVLAMTFGLDEIIVANGVYNTANEAVTPDSAVRGFIWPSTYALVFRKASSGNDVRETTLGRTFVYDLASTIGSLAVGSLDTMRALTLEWYRDEKISADVFRTREYIDMTVLVPTSGALIKNI
jgi:hypothetical protein